MAEPLASNRQPLEFVVVLDRRARELLFRTSVWSRVIDQAPFCIAVRGRPSVSRHWVEDCSAEAQTSCWRPPPWVLPLSGSVSVQHKSAFSTLASACTFPQK